MDSLEISGVYRAADLRVKVGVAEGDCLSVADDLVLDDIYRLEPASASTALSLVPEGQHFRQSGGGNLMVLDCAITLTDPAGAMIEAIVIVEVAQGLIEEIYLLPLNPISPYVDYRLIGIDRQAATQRFAETAWVSFVKGTRISLSGGALCPIEELKVGDMIQTRDSGAQPLRWIGAHTMRAVGTLAPVRIKAQAFYNVADLVVAPDHRLFVWQQSDSLGTGRQEALVKARHLINGAEVVQEPGGFVDYFQLLFDDHQIIYAEGIPMESLLVDPRASGALPEHMSARLKRSPQHEPYGRSYEVRESLLAGGDALALVQRASRGSTQH